MTDWEKREAVRYLGYGSHAVDEKTLALISDSFTELKQRVQGKSIYRIFDCIHGETSDGTEWIQIGNMKIESKSLAKNLQGCENVIVFGATLGTEVDWLMKRYSLTDMARAVVWQACAAAYLEEYCDEMQQKLGEEFAMEDKWLRSRFSPGYGDFDIHHQEEILRMLDAAKTIGLMRTESDMLTPTKSVTAIIGISRQKEPCSPKGCEACEKQDCIYRRS